MKEERQIAIWMVWIEVLVGAVFLLAMIFLAKRNSKQQTLPWVGATGIVSLVVSGGVFTFFLYSRILLKGLEREGDPPENLDEGRGMEGSPPPIPYHLHQFPLPKPSPDPKLTNPAHPIEEQQMRAGQGKEAIWEPSKTEERQDGQEKSVTKTTYPEDTLEKSKLLLSPEEQDLQETKKKDDRGFLRETLEKEPKIQLIRKQLEDSHNLDRSNFPTNRNSNDVIQSNLLRMIPDPHLFQGRQGNRENEDDNLFEYHNLQGKGSGWSSFDKIPSCSTNPKESREDESLDSSLEEPDPEIGTNPLLSHAKDERLFHQKRRDNRELGAFPNWHLRNQTWNR